MYTGELKPFSIEAAIKGGKVVTRKGYSVILTSVQITSPFGGKRGFPIQGFVLCEGQDEPRLECWTIKGEYIGGGAEAYKDLFMAED